MANPGHTRTPMTLAEATAGKMAIPGMETTAYRLLRLAATNAATQSASNEPWPGSTPPGPCSSRNSNGGRATARPNE